MDQCRAEGSPLRVCFESTEVEADVLAVCLELIR